MEAALLSIARGSSPSETMRRHPRLDPDTFFDHMRSLDARRVETFLQEANRIVLTDAKASGVLPKRCIVAFDLHVDPDYSKKHEGCIGYPDLPGTKHGMAYLSSESVTKNARFTFGATPIRAATNREEALKLLVEETLKWTDIELSLLDRGFAAIYAFDLFTKLDKRFVIPMIRNERIDKLEKEAYRARRSIPGTPYSWHVVEHYELGQHGKRQARVKLVFFYEPNPKETSKDDVFIFATNAGELSAGEIASYAKRYRERWGIETGYRVKDKLRVRTASDHYSVRLFLQLMSVLAYNLWTLVRALIQQVLNASGGKPRDEYRVLIFKDDIIAAFSE